MKFSKKIPKNISIINSYRAIGILIVCIAHFTCNITDFFFSHTVKGFPPPFIYIHNIGYMAVIVFFTVSGFVIPWWLYHCKYRIRDYGRFVARRMIRIEPPFLVALGLAILYTYIRTMSPYYNGVETFPTTKQILLHLGYLIPFYHDQQWIRPAYWTLAIECQWYLVMGLMYPLFFNKNLFVRIITYISILIPCYMVNSYLLQFFPVLLMGTLLCSYVTNTIDIKEYVFISILFLCYLFYMDGVLVFLASMVVIPLILLGASYNNKTLNFIGTMSYSIYLMHSLTGTALINYFSHVVVNPFYKILLVIASILFTLLCSYVFYRLIEKTSHKISLKIAVNEHELKPKKVK